MTITKEVQEKLGQLLQTHGITYTWGSLLRTRVAQSQSPSTADILSASELQNFSEKFPDVLYGLSIGEVSVLYEYSLAYINRASRKVEGQYFTPDDVACFMTERSTVFSKTAVWIDPCAGVGTLSYWLIKMQNDPEDFIRTRMYLIDRDPTALLIARVLFTLSFAKTSKKFFTQIRPRFICVDFLVANDLPKFDAAILNPPYVSNTDAPDSHYRTANTKNTYAFFVERVITLCNEGYISITPQTFTNAARLASLRKVILEGHAAIDVYCFDNVPDNIFSGVKFGSGNTNKANSTRAGIIVAHASEQQKHRITPLLRWRSHQREQMLASASTFLASASFSESIFPKVDKELVSLYKEVSALKIKLKDLLHDSPTEYVLQVPTTPRYFISANKKPVSRTSFKMLYFFNEGDCNRAYVLLNSSYMYWWWRVNDGGMTISEKTLLDLPIPEISDEGIQELVKDLEESEKTSKVMKMNAGKPIENIKHTPGMIMMLTQKIFPTHAHALSATHKNSHIESHIEQLSIAL